MSELRVELIYAACMFKGAALIDQIVLILNKFERSNSAAQNEEKRSVAKKRT